MRAWTAPEGFVVDLGPSSEPLVAALVAELPVKDLRDFVRLDSRGRLLMRCGVQAWSVEDELGASAHEVVDGELRRVSVSLFTMGGYRVVRETHVIVDGLRELPIGEVPLGDFAQKEARRVAAVDFGPEVRRVQELLGPRARNELDLELLRLLERLAGRRDPALPAFLNVCLLAAGVEDVPDGPPLAGAEFATLGRLLRERGAGRAAQRLP